MERVAPEEVAVPEADRGETTADCAEHAERDLTDDGYFVWTQSEFETFDRRFENIRKAAEGLTESHRTLQTENDELRTAANRRDERTAMVEEDNEKLKSHLWCADKRLRELSAKVDSLTEELGLAAERLADKTTLADALDADLDHLKKYNIRLYIELKETRQAAEKAAKQLADQAASISTLESEKIEMQKSIDDLEDRIRTADEENEQLIRDADRMVTDVEDAMSMVSFQRDELCSANRQLVEQLAAVKEIYRITKEQSEYLGDIDDDLTQGKNVIIDVIKSRRGTTATGLEGQSLANLCRTLVEETQTEKNHIAACLVDAVVKNKRYKNRMDELAAEHKRFQNVIYEKSMEQVRFCARRKTHEEL